MLDVDPRLGALGYHTAAFTRTFAIEPGSAAHNAGRAGTPRRPGGLDQRGYPRYSGGCDSTTGSCLSDLGAFEIQE